MTSANSKIDDDGDAGDNNDVEVPQWACDFLGFDKKRCFEGNTLSHCFKHTVTLFSTAF